MSQKMLSRWRKVFARGSTLLSAVALATVMTVGSAPAQSNKVVMGVWGGTWGKFLREHINAFAAKNDIEVVYVEGTSNVLLTKVTAQRNKPQMDIYLGNETTMAMSKKVGVSTPLDEKIVTNFKDLSPDYRKSDALIWAYWPVGFVYLRDEFQKNKLPLPDSWLALLRSDLKGKACAIAPPDLYGQATLIGLAIALGKNQYDLSPAFSKLGELKANVLTAVQAPGQAEDLLRAKECWLYPTAPARAYLMQQKDPNVGFIVPKETAVVSENAVMLVKDGPNPTAAQKILNFMISPEFQEQAAKFGTVMPANSKASSTPEMIAYMGSIGTPGRSSAPIDGEYGATRLNGWANQWTQVFAR